MQLHSSLLDLAAAFGTGRNHIIECILVRPTAYPNLLKDEACSFFLLSDLALIACCDMELSFHFS